MSPAAHPGAAPGASIEVPDEPIDQIAETGRQWIGHDWPLPGTMVAITSVMRSNQLVMGRMESILREFDLTVARYEILIMLYFSKRSSLPLSRIGVRLQVHQASVTRVVDGLVALGYVTRKEHPTDRRTRLAVLTPAGRSAVLAAKTRVAADLFEHLGLTADEQRQLVALLNKVRAAGGDHVDEQTLSAIAAES